VLLLIAGPEVVDGDEEGQESHHHGQLHEGGNHSADHSGAFGYPLFSIFKHGYKSTKT